MDPCDRLAREANARLGWVWAIRGTEISGRVYRAVSCDYGEWAEYDGAYRFLMNEERPLPGTDELLAILHGKFLLDASLRGTE